MFKRTLKRKKPNIYLGKIIVVPRSNLRRNLEDNLYTGERLEEALNTHLNMIFDIPLASECITPNKTDLAIDVIIENFQAGNYLEIYSGNFSAPIIWRPKIKIASRLYNINTGKTKHTALVTIKLPWKEYFSRFFTWRAFFGLRPMFDANDMKILLSQACLQLLKKTIRAV
ncbi:hypothetical protein [Pseudomonas anguilliseptica]|uniref:hypothetical protein n=1 Tax=Pseudomonas anguilliseptica TaxID=53406 RepID=UPI001F461CAF|nr:hypothetical protein [Pseudomonas anguilliseptica]MCE5365333.1 hypothetical protein [Pseudomonas anguilliseptica]